MYSLVSTCIRPKVYDEAEEIILPPTAFTTSASSASANPQNNDDNMVVNKQKQGGASSTKISPPSVTLLRQNHPLIQQLNDVPLVPLQTPTHDMHSKSFSPNCTQNHTPIPSIEVLYPSQSSSVSECILIQSPSRTRPRTSFGKSSSSISATSGATDSPSSTGGETICVPWTISSDEYDDEDNNSPKPIGFVIKEVPLYYSPLITLDEQPNKTSKSQKLPNLYISQNNSNNIQQKHKNKQQHHTIPSPHQLKKHSERWKYQSSLAGSHSQHSHVLDVSHWPNISLQSLKCGVTPNIAKNITDFTFSVKDESFDVPSFLDLVIGLFPKLKHLTLVEKINYDDGGGEEDGGEEDGHEEDEREYEDDEHDDDDVELNSMINSFKTPRNNARVKVYSADGDDQDMVDDLEYYEVATASSQKVPNFPEVLQESSTTLPPVSSSIALQAMQMAEKESQRMKRLYILYRLPDLISINGQVVTEEERNLARPMSPSGNKVKHQEWLTQAMAVKIGRMKSEGIPQPLVADSDTNKNITGDEYTYDDDDIARARSNNSHYFSSEEDSSSDSVEQSSVHELKFDNRKESYEDDEAKPEESILKSNTKTAPIVVDMQPEPSSPSNNASSQKNQYQIHATAKQLASPSRSNLSGIFPHTGKSTTPKRPTAKLDLRTVGSPTTKKELYNRQILATSPKHELASSPIHSSGNLASIHENMNVSPSKTNLDSFIAKDKARGLSKHNHITAAPSEATDIAIAGHLLSRCNLQINKENTVHAVSPFVSQLENEQISCSLDKKAVKKRTKDLRRKQRKERPMPLVGSMVRVKVKKGKRESLPPPSPASTFREFPMSKQKKNRPFASIIDQMDDDCDDVDEENEIDFN